MILWRLSEDNIRTGLFEGCCISEEKYKSVYYSDRCLYSPITEIEIKDMIEYNDERYCIENGVEKLLFYNEIELNDFLKKIQ